MKCLLTYKLSLSLFSPEITFENTNFSIISRETKTEIMCLSLRMSLRIFVNPGPGLPFPKICFSQDQFNLTKSYAQSSLYGNSYKCINLFYCYWKEYPGDLYIASISCHMLAAEVYPLDLCPMLTHPTPLPPPASLNSILCSYYNSACGRVSFQYTRE